MKTGDQIGRYELRDELGRGAMATVYEAFDPGINRTLAIKILLNERTSDSEYRYRFLREAKAAGKLSHPNIVTVYDVGEADDHPYMAMELLQGESLDDVMKGHEPLVLTDVISIGIQLAEALDYAHTHGIVHRDIKPSNIVRLNSDNSIKITDFGIAHMESSEVTEQTKIGTMLGTPQYMSPEQIMARGLDGRSDLFSVGVILYQMVTGQKPFNADTQTSLFMKIVKDDPPTIASLVGDVPVALVQVIDKLLRKQPENRFQSGRELANTLKRILHHVEEQALEASERRIVPLRVKWTLLMAAIVALTMVFGAAVIYKQQYESMSALALDYGVSLAKFIAMESAEPLLIQDWISIETFVKETDERQELSFLSIADHKGVVRGSTDGGAVGAEYIEPRDTEFRTETGGTRIFERDVSDGERAFDFDTPVLFQNKLIGRVHLGMSQAPLDRVARLTVAMMLVLMLVTIGAVMVVTYILTTRLSKPMRSLRRSLGQLADGHYEHRIVEERRDEFGLLFNAFNQMAESLQMERQALPAQESEVAPSDPGPSSSGDDSIAEEMPTRVSRILDADELHATGAARAPMAAKEGRGGDDGG